MDPRRKAAGLLSRALTKRRPRLWAGARIGRSHELYREEGENFRSVRLQVSEDRFQIDTHDMGRATEEFWGDSDYEFWTVVQRTEWPKLLAGLAKETGARPPASNPESWRELSGAQQAELLAEVSRVLFANDSRATDRLRDICDEHGVESSGGSWV